MNRTQRLVLGMTFAVAALATAVPGTADHGDPSTRPDPAPAAYTPVGNGATAALKQDSLQITVAMTPAQPKLGDLVQIGLRVHDPDRNADFSGAIKVTVLDGDDHELVSGSALSEGGQGSFLYLLTAGGTYRFRFDFDAEIPAWTPSAAKPAAATGAPLAATLPTKGRVQCEIQVEGAQAEIPLPYLIGGGVALLLAAFVFLRKRSA